MRVTRSLVVVSGVDCVLFLAAWVLYDVPSAAFAHVHPLVGVGYWIAAFAGFVLSAWSFWVVTRGRPEDFRRSVVCILLTFLPGCVGLVELLSKLGTHPV
ncbi:hypothetical protein [Alicyclobacillus pomorum]|uniref:hypothetical protein n=1 Tax=Alicyclobacillus pomorum TaxID=204470 RepID=UPI0003F4BEF6|nr:hypothetical protein [Alicyclobacillus pomorum]